MYHHKLHVATAIHETIGKKTNMVIRNGKMVWKNGPHCWYFRLNFKYLGWPYREYIKTAKYGGFCEGLLSENDFEVVLTTFFYYDYGANVSEAVQRITTDQKGYHKCSSFVIVCWIAKMYQSITVKKVGYLLPRTLPALLKKRQKLHRKRTNNWSIVSFIHSGSEITTWMGYSFKTKSTKSKAKQHF